MRKLVTILLVSAALALADAPSVIAIRDAKIVPVSGPVLPSGTVVLRNGLIEAVGANVQPPADAWVIDGKGLTVYPGLIDGLSTVGMPQATPAAAPAGGRGAGGGGMQAAMAAAANAPVIRGPEDRPSTTSWVIAADQVNPTERRIETFRNGGFTTTVTFPTTGIFAGQGSIIDLAGEKAGQMVVQSPVGQYISMRTAGGFGGSFPSALFGVISYVRQIYLDIDQYKAAKKAYAENPRGMARPDYDRALEGVMASPRILLPAGRAVEIARMTKFSAELKQPTILYGGLEGYRVADQIKLPMLVSLKWPEKPRDSDPDEVDSTRTLENRAMAPSTPGALAKAGVKFAFYSDGIERPADILAAAKKAIDAGLSADQALRAMTLSVAEMYGVDDRIGSIEKGKIANLVVVKGDLFEKGQVQMVFVDGQKFEPAPEEAPQGGGPGAGARRPTGGVE